LDKEIIRLSVKQNSSISEGLKNIENGETFTNKEAHKMVDEWLEKR
jgi:predicted transcriptional regulator